MSVALDLGVPAERLDHGLSIQPQGSEPEAQLALGEVGAISSLNPHRGHPLGGPVQVEDLPKLLDRRHPAIAFQEDLLDLRRGIGGLGPHRWPPAEGTTVLVTGLRYRDRYRKPW